MRVPMQRSLKDVLAGLALAAFGVAFAIGAMTYTVGSPVRMGPGFFPLIVGALLAVLGVVVVRLLAGVEIPVVNPHDIVVRVSGCRTQQEGGGDGEGRARGGGSHSDHAPQHQVSRAGAGRRRK